MPYLDKIRVDGQDYDIGNNIEETLPVGTEIDIDKNTSIPDGWVEIEYDTGWVNLELGDNVTVRVDSTTDENFLAQIRRIGDTVYVKGMLDGTNLTSGAVHKIIKNINAKFMPTDYTIKCFNSSIFSKQSDLSGLYYWKSETASNFIALNGVWTVSSDTKRIKKIAQTGTTDSNYQLGTVLWENPNPTQSFTEQDITLSSDDYDYLLVEFAVDAASETVTMDSCVILKGYGGKLVSNNLWANAGYAASRGIKYNNTTSYTVYHCHTVTEFSPFTYERNDVINVPIKIIGIKNTIPTVVQKEWQVYDDQERVIGTWFGKPLYRKVINFQYVNNDWDSQARWFTKSTSNIITNLANIDYLKLNNWIIDKKTQLPLLFHNGVDDNNDKWAIKYCFDGDNMRLSIGTRIDEITFANKINTIIIEYTKITD